jgi:hypothetical protein
MCNKHRNVSNKNARYKELRTTLLFFGANVLVGLWTVATPIMLGWITRLSLFSWGSRERSIFFVLIGIAFISLITLQGKWYARINTMDSTLKKIVFVLLGILGLVVYVGSLVLFYNLARFIS